MDGAYVIGLSPHNLLNIELGFNFDDGCYKVIRIIHGFRHISQTTIIDGLSNAKEILKEIQDRYNEINVMADNLVESIINGNDIDPMQLHIYQVKVGWKVMEM